MAEGTAREASGASPRGSAEGWGSRCRVAPQCTGQAPQWPIGSGGLPPSSDDEARRTPGCFSGPRPHGMKRPGVRLRSSQDDGRVNGIFGDASSGREIPEGAALMRGPGASSADPYRGWFYGVLYWLLHMLLYWPRNRRSYGVTPGTTYRDFARANPCLAWRGAVAPQTPFPVATLLASRCAGSPVFC